MKKILNFACLFSFLLISVGAYAVNTATGAASEDNHNPILGATVPEQGFTIGPAQDELRLSLLVKNFLAGNNPVQLGPFNVDDSTLQQGQRNRRNADGRIAWASTKNQNMVLFIIGNKF